MTPSTPFTLFLGIDIMNSLSPFQGAPDELLIWKHCEHLEAESTDPAVIEFSFSQLAVYLPCVISKILTHLSQPPSPVVIRDLSGNSFTGNLTNDIGNLTELKYLCVYCALHT